MKKLDVKVRTGKYKTVTGYRFQVAGKTAAMYFLETCNLVFLYFSFRTLTVSKPYSWKMQAKR